MNLVTYAEMEAYLEETEAQLRASPMDGGAASSARVILAVWPAFFRAFDTEIRNHAPAEDLLFLAHALVLNILEHAVKTCADDQYHCEVAANLIDHLRRDLLKVMSGTEPAGFKIIPVKQVKIS